MLLDPDDALTILDAAGAVTFPVDEQLAELAFSAWKRFGTGRHPAALNFGDCVSYALAVHLEVPLLCVGDDFRRTDIEVIDVAPDGTGPD